MESSLENTIFQDIREDEDKLIDDNKLKVSIYAICKNELQFVDKWMDSMSEADYIVVLDTGSTDGSYERLLEYSKQNPRKYIIAQKKYNPWRFDTPRNDAMMLCPKDTDVYLSTDLDEWLEPGWYNILISKWIRGVTQRGDYTYVWSHMADGTPGRVFMYNKMHSKEWIWKYPVHELLWNTETETELYDISVAVSYGNSIVLHHYPDTSKSRSNYLPLLELRAEENENDYYGLIYLAHEYNYTYNYEKSNETLRKVIEKYNPGSLEAASCYLFMGDNYAAMDNFYEAIINYEKAITLEPTYREPYLNLAKLFIEKNKYNQAIGIIKDGLENSIRHYTWLERDRSWLDEPYDLLSLAYYYSGNKKEALVYAVKAYSLNRSDERLKNNVEEILKTMEDKDYL